MVQLCDGLLHAVPEKSFCFKWLLSFQHEIYGPAYFLSDQRQGLRFSVLTGESLLKALRRFVTAQEQNCCFAECPFEMGVSDLVVPSFHPLPRRLMGALHQSSVGDEVPDTRKAIDILDLIKDDQREHRTDTGNCPQKM